jgi:uncharacterized protein YsxB (DUF464 family)
VINVTIDLQNENRIKLNSSGHASKEICAVVSYATQSIVAWAESQNIDHQLTMINRQAPEVSTFRLDIASKPSVATLIASMVVSFRSLVKQHPEELKLDVL